MHTVQNYKLSKTKQVILMWETGSYSAAIDNFKVKKSALKVVEFVQNSPK